MLDTGSECEVTSVAFLPDGRYFLSGGQFAIRPPAGSLQSWNVETGAEEHRVKLRWLPTVSIAITRDGRWLAAGDLGRDEMNIRVLDAAAMREKVVLGGHKGGTCSVQFSPDGGLLISSGRDGAVRYWDTTKWTETGKFVANADVGPLNLCEMAISPGATPLLAVSSGKRGMEIALWNYQSRRLLRRLVGHTWPVNTVSFSPDGKLLVTGTTNLSAGLLLPPEEHDPQMQELWVWDVEKGTAIASLPGHRYTVTAAAFSPNGSLLATADLLGSVMLWNTADLVRAGGRGQNASLEKAR
jgi:WD40 repeat protein